MKGKSIVIRFRSELIKPYVKAHVAHEEPDSLIKLKLKAQIQDNL